MKYFTFMTLSFLFIFMISCTKKLTKSEVLSVNNGLMAYYPFNENVQDISGNQNHGKVSGAKLTYNRFNEPNSAYYFDGINDYIDLGDQFNYGFDSKFSICAWIKTESEDGLKTIFSKAENSPESNNLYMLTIHEQMPRALLRQDTKNDINAIKSMNLADNEWHFIVMTYDGLKNSYGLKLYVDEGKMIQGIKKGNPHTLSTTDPASIGSEAIGFRSRNFFNGSIDDVKIFNRVLDLEEIIFLKNIIE